MKLSLADRLALIYTSAGSQRAVAAATGLSHQQVGRILNRATMGLSTARWDNDLKIVARVETAYKAHVEHSREIAKAYGLPFDSSVPVYVERPYMDNRAVMIGDRSQFVGSLADAKRYAQGKPVIREYTDKRTGEIKKRVYRAKPEDLPKLRVAKILGERVAAEHVHWLSNRVRDAWVKSTQRTGRYYAISAGSVVEYALYAKQSRKRIADYLAQGGLTTEQRIKAQHAWKNLEKARKVSKAETGIEKKQLRLFTQYTPLNPQSKNDKLAADLAAYDLNRKIQEKHAPAVGADKTKLADKYLLQLDSTRNAPQANKGTNRGNTKRGKR